MIDPENPDYGNTPAENSRPQYSYAPKESSVRPAVSIITPYYNTGAIFHETARSVFCQSMQQWEWIIVNDCSTDPEAVAILDSFRDRDPRVRVIDHEKNGGPSAGRNTAFREATAPYAVQLDTDNLLEPTAIEKWLWLLESYPEFSFVKGYSVGFDAQQYLWKEGFHGGSVFLEQNLVDATCALRRSVHDSVGGYDETIRDGLEDWDFWLSCANSGHWGTTIPEYLDWYRRRDNHGDRWDTWDGGSREAAFRQQLRDRYPKLWTGGFPAPKARPPAPNETVPDVLPWENSLLKNKPRMLLLLPWLNMGGSDKFNLDLAREITARGWEITIATTLSGEHRWMEKFTAHTPDVFLLDHFVRPSDYPRFLRYLIQSRDIDVLVTSHSEFGYQLLPYLRAHFPELPLIDFCHIEEHDWKNGGYPQMSLTYQEILDKTLVSSKHLKEWMAARGADLESVSVCYTNVDTDSWRPASTRREITRKSMKVDTAKPIILFVGRLCAQKQPNILVETALLLKDREVDFTLVVVGDGPDMDGIKTFVRKNSLDQNVRILGAKPNDTIRDIMQAADLFFLPSKWEGIALCVFEAMACELPVVSANVGGQAELVTPDCGILIDPADQKNLFMQYADSIEELLADKESLVTMGRQARKRVVDLFGLTKMIDQVLEACTEARATRSNDRGRVGLGLGLACATQAVEYRRVSAVADSLWAMDSRDVGGEDQTAGTMPAAFLEAYQTSWRTRLYFSLRRALLPRYTAAIQNNGSWLLPLKNLIKNLLVRRVRYEK